MYRYTKATVVITNWLTVTKYPFWDRRGRDRMVVGFTTTCAISPYHH